jgi:hypothetical protein
MARSTPVECWTVAESAVDAVMLLTVMLLMSWTVSSVPVAGKRTL